MTGEDNVLSYEVFPNVALVKTYTTDSQVADSAPTATAWNTGVKTDNGVIGVNEEAVYDDCASQQGNEVMNLFELAEQAGMATGTVSTARLTHATPAANYAHTANRDWEADSDLSEEAVQNGCTDIAAQLLAFPYGDGLEVAIGGGRTNFLPDTAPDPEYGEEEMGARADGQNLTEVWTSQYDNAAYVWNQEQFDAVDPATTDHLLGLFEPSHVQYEADRAGDAAGEPSLTEMTQKALDVLNKNNSNGFVLMVEGASIDKQAHLMDTDRWVLETIEFDRAVQKAKEFAQANPDTIVIVTADHECSGAAIIGASMVTDAALRAKAATSADMRDTVVGVYDSAKFPAYSIAADGYPTTTDVNYKMLIGYGANADRYEAWISNPKPTQDSQQPFVGAAPLNTYPANPNVRNSSNGYLVTGQVPGDQAAHTATDVPLSAFGRGASLFTGVFDNTDVFFKLGQIAIGGAR